MNYKSYSNKLCLNNLQVILYVMFKFSRYLFQFIMILCVHIARQRYGSKESLQVGHRVIIFSPSRRGAIASCKVKWLVKNFIGISIKFVFEVMACGVTELSVRSPTQRESRI